MQKLHIALHYLIAFLLGSIAVLTLPPFELWPVLFISFGVFYYQLTIIQTSHQHWIKRFFIGWFFGFGYFVFGLYWIGNALLVEGNNFEWAWPLAVIGLPIVLSIFTGLASLLTCRLFNLQKLAGYLGAVAVFALFEWVRGTMFTGFPWNLYGYGWHSLEQVFQILSITGIYGLTLLTLLWCFLPGYFVIHRFSCKIATAFVIAMVILFDVIFIYGHYQLKKPTQFDETTQIIMVQPNIAISDKWDNSKHLEHMNTLASLSVPQTDNNDHKTTLIIWPETAITDRSLKNTQTLLAIRSAFERHVDDTYLITGHLRYDAPSEHNQRHKIYNSLTILDRNLSIVGKYDKAHLVPFGEYIPFQEHIPLLENDLIQTVTRFSGFQKGQGAQNLPISESLNFSPIICYEVIFSKNIIKPTKKYSQLIINVTNDGWYGNSTGPHQHFTKAQARAIEFGIPVIRSANTGISGVIDHKGRTIQSLELNKSGSFAVQRPLPKGTPTLFSKTGNIPFYFICFLLIALALCKAHNKSLQPTISKSA